MNRLWLSLLLLFSLWPNPAAAEEIAARTLSHELSASAVEYSPEAVRSPSGVELLSRAGQPLPDGQRRTIVEPPIHPGSELVWSSAPSLVVYEKAAAACTATPLCERLPYYATAPPSLR